MSISTRAFKLSKQIAFSKATGKLLNAFHRNHLYLELVFDGTSDKDFSYYHCFDKFEADLDVWLDKHCKGLWASEPAISPLSAGRQTTKLHNGNYKSNPDGALLKMHLYLEEPDDLALFLKEKGLLLKLTIE